MHTRKVNYYLLLIHVHQKYQSMRLFLIIQIFKIHTKITHLIILL